MSAAGDWPRTTRLMPWLLATFLVMVWLVPYEAIKFSVPLPVDPLPDRFLLIIIVAAMAAITLVTRKLPGHRPSPGFWQALLVFTVVAMVSLAFNASRAAGVGEIDQGTKKVLLLWGNVVLFYVVARVMRPSELKPFSIFIIILASLAAAGTIWEYRTDYNVFYDYAYKLFNHVASVAPTPGITDDGRDDTFGPTQHGLAVTTMLAIALPFAVLAMLRAPTRGKKILYGIATALILTGALSTLRKTGLIAPVTALLVLVAYQPRQMARLAPLAVIMVGVIHGMAPGALGGVGSQLTDNFLGAGTTVGRTSDYAAVEPDYATHPFFGRGYGTPDVSKSNTYRILDNQYLGQLVQVGFVGLIIYMALMFAGVLLAHDVIKHGITADRRVVGLAAAAGFVAFAVVSALFDVFSFSEGPYLFVFVAGMCSVAASAPEPEPELVSVPAPPPATAPVLEPVPAS
jgi:O-antigen ligase